MNFLMIAVDSLRADRLGCYGYDRPTTPFIDAVARRSAVFDNCYAPSIPTQPSFTCMFTGQWPTTHGIVAHRGRWSLGEAAPFLPEFLQRAGYATAAVDNLADHHKPWFSRGFGACLNPREAGSYPECFRFNELALDWLNARDREPFFLFVHYWDPHTPYMPPVAYRDLFYTSDPTVENRGSLDEFYRRPLRSWWTSGWLGRMASEWPDAAGAQITDIEFVRSQYDAEVRCVDDGVRELLGALEDLGIAEETAVFIFSDHGEELGEHGIYFDHHGLYESDIRVPLIVRWPAAGFNGSRIRSLAQLTDIAPTVLEGAGLPAPRRMDGRSLLPFIRGGSDREEGELLLSQECTWMAKWAVCKAGWKLIAALEPDFYGNPMRELYDLNNDPSEQRNLALELPEKTREMGEILASELSRRLARGGRTVDPVEAHGITLGREMFA
ncbi:MAG: sulfatase [Gemmatimonadota bacterium]|nr:sulfatase [Gemmatimonadota bacterium]